MTSNQSSGAVTGESPTGPPDAAPAPPSRTNGPSDPAPGADADAGPQRGDGADRRDAQATPRDNAPDGGDGRSEEKVDDKGKRPER